MTTPSPRARVSRAFIAAATTVALAGGVCVAVVPAAAGASVTTVAASATDPVGDRALLTDPLLQAPTADGASVVWFTEFSGSRHAVLVGPGVEALTSAQLAAAGRGQAFPGVTLFVADTSKLSSVAEDYQSNIDPAIRPAQSEGIVPRDVWRHEGVVSGLTAGARVPYRVVSIDGFGGIAGSGTFTLQPAVPAGTAMNIMLTSDHQAMVNTPANLAKAAETLGTIDAVFLAGDLVNIPDRASEWFDDTRGSGFFPALQGNGGRVSTGGVQYSGGEIVQHAPLYPAVGNHEVQGRRDGAVSLGSSFNSPVPRDIAEQAYEVRAAEVNPTGDPAIKEKWIVDNSFSTTTYEEIFTLPSGSPGGETYYATTVGDVRLVSLYSTRIWRGTTATPDPAARTASSRYQESAASLGDPMAQGYGEHIFEAIDASSEQYAWLQEELESEAFADARYRVVMLHEGPQGLGDNVMPQFADPQRIEERNAAGDLVGVRYEYPATENELLYDLQPLLEDAGVDLVHNGHSHLWNRFVSDNGVTNWMETSNTGNTYGAYHPLSGRSRPVPPAPWDAANYWAQNNPGGLEPIVPNVAPFIGADGQPQPFVQNNDLAVFTGFDTGSGLVTTYAFNVKTPDVAPVVIDQFGIGRPASGDGIELAVTVAGEAAPGELVWTVDDKSPVDLGTAESAGDHLRAEGALAAITVTDTRSTSPAWSVTGSVDEFTSGSGEMLGGHLLGWTPKVLAPGAGAIAGATVASGRTGGTGLSTPAVLGRAPSGHERGSTSLGADLLLEVPVDAPTGRFTATMTITALG